MQNNFFFVYSEIHKHTVYMLFIENVQHVWIKKILQSIALDKMVAGIYYVNTCC